MNRQQIFRSVIPFAFVSAVAVGCGGADATSPETTAEVLASSDSETTEAAPSTTEAQREAEPQDEIEEQAANVEQAQSLSSDLLVSLLTEELMSDPEIPVELSIETATCVAEWAFTKWNIENMDDLEALEGTENEMWMEGLAECADSSTMIKFIVSEMGASAEQTQCLIDSLGDETEGLTALFNMDSEPETEEQMTFLFTFMAAAMECGVDLLGEIESGAGVDEYESSAAFEPVADPMCPNSEPCICIDVDGSCTDGDDDWGWIDNGKETYFCSNDGKEYAEYMGGMLCAETTENA